MHKVEEIIAPVDRELLKSELTQDRFLRHTNNGDNLVYLVNYHNAPNVVREIDLPNQGKLRIPQSTAWETEHRVLS